MARLTSTLRAAGPEVGFFLVAAALLGWNLGAGSLLPSDDCLYATAAREMARSGDLVTPTWQGRPLFEKGPVLSWALAASQALVPDGEAAARLPGVVAGVAVLVLAWRLALAVGLSRWAALGAVALALASNALYFNARRPMTDLPALAFGLAGFLLLLCGRQPFLAGVLWGLSALTKVSGPVPYVLAFGFLQAVPRFRLGARATGWALLGAALVAVPWHAAMVATHGRAFLDVYFGYHVFQRAARAVVGDASDPTYVAWLVEREGALALVFAAALVAVVVRAVRRDGAALVSAALWVGAGLPLALARTSLPHYLVACLPAAALSCGVLAQGGLELARRARAQAYLVVAAFFGVALAAFEGNNGDDLARPAYGEDTRVLCEALREPPPGGGGSRLAGTCDLHDPCVSWYCDASVSFYALDPGFYEAVRDIPALQGVVRPLDGPALRDLASRRAWLLVRPDRLPALADFATATGARLETRAQAPTRVLVEVTPGPRGE